MFGVDQIGIAVTAQASSSTNDLELTLVLDNTGSMASSMTDLKAAANDLVDTIFDNAASGDQIKIGVVPYVGPINIGNGGTQLSWMDTAGRIIQRPRHCTGEPVLWLRTRLQPYRR